MKAARIHAFGGSDRIAFDTMPMPVEKPGALLVLVRAAGVNPIDWKIREGYFPRPLPIILGQDFAGVVAGSGSDTFKAGAAVFGMLPTEATGSYAGFVQVPPAWVAKAPAGLTPEQAAGLPMGSLTAWMALFDRGALKPGQRVLIHGAAGAVGGMAVQLAKAKGAWVAGTASGAGLATARSYGADLVIDHQTEKFEEVIATAGGVDLVLDTQAGETRRRSWAALRAGGAVVSTLGPTEPPPEYAARTRGLPGFGTVPDGDRLAEIAALIVAGKLKAPAVRSLPFEEAAAAMDLNQTGKAGQKIVLSLATKEPTP